MLLNNKSFNSICKSAMMPLLVLFSMNGHIHSFTEKVQNNVASKSCFSWVKFKKKISYAIRSIKRSIKNNEEFLKGVGACVLALATYKYGSELFAWLFPYTVFKDTIPLGNATVKANVRQEENHIIRQILVPAQGRDMCGYHVAYNSIGLVNVQLNPDYNMQVFLPATDSCVKSWCKKRAAIPPHSEYPDYNADGTSISGAVINQILTQERAVGGLLHGLGAESYRIDVIDFHGAPDDRGVADVQASFNHLDDAVQAEINNLDVYIAIVNTDTPYINRVLTERDIVRDHWIVVALQRDSNNGARTYTIADSINAERVHTRNIAHDVIDWLEGIFNNGNAAQQHKQPQQ